MEETKLQVVAGQSVKHGLTAKQEAFAQQVAKGKTLSDAYRHSYDAENMKDATVWNEASRLMDNPQVSARVKSIQDAVEAKTLHDQARLKRLVLERLHQEAMTADSDSARIRALELLGKSIAMFTDKVEQETNEKSANELERELIDRLSRLSGTDA